MSQGDIEKDTGPLRGYVSRVENGHTVPNIETLEKLAAAFDVPLWKIFYEGGQKAPALLSSRDLGQSEIEWVKDRKFYLKLARLLGRMRHTGRYKVAEVLRSCADPFRISTSPVRELIFLWRQPKDGTLLSNG